MALMHKLVAWMVVLGTSAVAQPATECQLLLQRLASRTGDVKLCLALYQYCVERAASDSNAPAAKNQCSADLGGCQMGGALEGEDRQQALAHFKKRCEKSTKLHPNLADSVHQ